MKDFFGNKCCYCDADFSPDRRAVQDHLIPMNKTALGLHAWGNIVPACEACNAKKQGRDWREFIIERAGAHSAERLSRVKEFLSESGYRPSLDLQSVAGELHDEVGSVSMVLVRAKVDRVKNRIIEHPPSPAASSRAPS